MEQKDKRIADSLYLLSRNNHWDALKIVYDILINETFVYAKKTKKHKQHIIEKKGKDIICILYDYLEKNNVKNLEPIVSEIRLLTIFFDNYSREALNSTTHNYKLEVLTLNLIGLIKFLSKNTSGLAYYFGQIDSNLLEEIQNNVTEEIYESTEPYFELWLEIKSTFKEDFWSDLDCFSPDGSFGKENCPSVFTSIEFELLLRYKEIIDEFQFSFGENEENEITQIWNNDLSFDEIKQKVLYQYYLKELFELLNKFRKADISSSKYGKNVYKKELEEAFHKNIYPFITEKGGYDLVLSEHNSGRQRHDIVIYSYQTSLSAIIELKVNDLKKPEDNLEQLINYIDKVTDKPFVYLEEPNIGALVIYYIGDQELADIDLTILISQTKYPLIKHSDNFYLLVSEYLDNKPILICLLDGKA